MYTHSEILQECRRELMRKEGVVATGVGYRMVNGRPTRNLAIVCSVESKKPSRMLSSKDKIPFQIDGVYTDVQQTGQIYALQARTDKWRPAPGGVSIGHPSITAGTLGCLVRRGEEIFILSNNHVMAASNDASVGDPILQPGTADGGGVDDDIAVLSEFVPINFGRQCPLPFAKNWIPSFIKDRFATDDNLVDAAIAHVILEDGDVVNDILEIGQIAGEQVGSLGLEIKKSGRTTGLTTGSILQVDVTVNVSYGAGKTATFTDQLMAGAISQGGDSGSAVLDTDNNIVGLLFAGSSTTTIINRIQNVFDLLDVEPLLSAI